MPGNNGNGVVVQAEHSSGHLGRETHHRVAAQQAHFQAMG
jgi:hypothetical protein